MKSNQILEHLTLRSPELPDLTRWGEEMLVPFPGCRLAKASVVWLNRRWFKGKGILCETIETRKIIDEWLLSNFAFKVPQPFNHSSDYSGHQVVLHADRYGGTGLVPHGGSGRVSCHGIFQAKGVGTTPLVGKGTDWLHSHGHLWLEEAIREAILSEVFFLEFPHGASRSIAIIDAGFNFKDKNDVLGERCSILVRESSLRPAHFMRAPGFRPLGAPPQGQVQDARRVKDAIIQLESTSRVTNASPILQCAVNTGEQVGFGQTHRLFSGGYFASNFTMCGGIVDFGGARSFPNWERAIIKTGARAFGEEIAVLEAVLTALTYYWNKNVQDEQSRVSPDSLVRAAKQAMAQKRRHEFKRIWGFAADDSSAAGHTVEEAMQTYYEQQQLSTSDYTKYREYDPEWLYKDNSTVGVHSRVTSATAIQIEHIVRSEYSPGEASTRIANAQRILSPRALGREQLQSLLFDNVVGHRQDKPPHREAVEEVIETVVEQNLRTVSANECTHEHHRISISQ